MPESSNEEYRKINSIIERDSTDSTYKYALLRGTIEICEEYQHLGKEEEDKIWFPLGLLIEKYILYYYPIIANEKYLPQMSGETSEPNNHLRMAFRPLLTEIVEYYKNNGKGFSDFYQEYESGTISKDIIDTFLTLCRKLRKTIVEMPMHHLGYSQAKVPYSVYTYRKNEPRIATSETIDRDFLVQNFGEFSISKELNTVFRYFGGFISGENTLLLKWATLSSKKSNGLISVAEVMEILQEVPETERDTLEAQRFYKHLWDIKEDVVCVWTGHKINSLAGCNIDHVLPFTIWKNNELWNLMPALPDVNGKKSDKIPSVKLLDARKEAILHYWDLMLMWKDQQNPFEKEIRISLTGKPFDPALWKEHAFNALKNKCEDLILIRGFTEWDL